MSEKNINLSNSVEMIVDDRGEAGRLIIGLSTGEIDIPTCNKSAIELLAKYGVKLNNYDPDKLDIKFVKRDDAVYLVIPPAQVMRDRIEEYKDYSSEYPLAQEYVDYVLKTENAPDTLELFYVRVGDYVFGQCR